MRIAIALLAFLLAALPASVLAQEVGLPGGGLIVRIDGDVSVPAGERVGSIFLIDGDAQIDGTVEDWLAVIDGTVVVNGRIEGGVLAIDAVVDVRSGGVIEGNVRLIESDLQEEPGAQVLGDVRDQWRPAWWMWFAFNAILWAGFTIAFLVAGLVLAAAAGHRLTTATTLMTGQAGRSILAALITWVAVPVLAFVAFVTVVGIPLAVGLLLLFLPLIWLLGYLIAGSLLGRLILSGLGARENLYVAVLIGVLLLQLVVLIPVLGWLMAILMGLWGSGALVLAGWHAFRERGGPEAAAV